MVACASREERTLAGIEGLWDTGTGCSHRIRLSRVTEPAQARGRGTGRVSRGLAQQRCSLDIPGTAIVDTANLSSRTLDV